MIKLGQQSILRLVIFVCMLIGVLSTPLQAQDKSGAGPATTMPSPAQFRATLDAYQGKVLIVNVWATWCVPCLREIPDLLTLQAEFSAQGVVLIGVAVDEPSPGALDVERYRKRYFPTFRTYARSGSDLDELTRVLDPAWNEVVPTTYLVGRDGQIKRRIQGKRSLEQFRVALQAVL
jgi:thiol-disulfide isomerase/thioredoxin